ncbi:hypothetical protein DFQ27_003657 [Actinomortierella ambigua]|uniref:F-box domain-containing protein n=1 Tax=Actinomortierella ambigua TaxID=1343610 RepID=A0A9P6Q8E9_9FUNG|nr:hypothetical protein DFQ27_003657 [Actinomortierella ambigua]
MTRRQQRRRTQAKPPNASALTSNNNNNIKDPCWPTRTQPCHPQTHDNHNHQARNRVLFTSELLTAVVAYLQPVDLCQLARTCQIWQMTFEPFIYKDTHIVGSLPPPPKCSTCKPPQEPRPLICRCCGRVGLGTGMTLARLREYGHLVESIRIRGYHTDKQLLRILQQYPLPRLRHVDLVDHEFESQQMLVAILKQLASVRHLVINGYSPKILQLNQPNRLYVIEAIQQHCRDHLEVLELGHRAEMPTFLIASLVQSMPALRRLEFGSRLPTVSLSKRDLMDPLRCQFPMLAPPPIMSHLSRMPLPTWQNNTLEDIGFDLVLTSIDSDSHPLDKAGRLALPIWLKHLILPLKALRRVRLETWLDLSIPDWTLISDRLTNVEDLSLRVEPSPSRLRLPLHAETSHAILFTIESKMPRLRSLTLMRRGPFATGTIYPGAANLKVQGPNLFRHLIHLQKLSIFHLEVTEDALLSLADCAAAVTEAGWGPSSSSSPRAYHPLVSLDLYGCNNVTAHAVRAILTVCGHLEVLNLMVTNACSLELFDGPAAWACAKTLRVASFDIVRLHESDDAEEDEDDEDNVGAHPSDDRFCPRCCGIVDPHDIDSDDDSDSDSDHQPSSIPTTPSDPSLPPTLPPLIIPPFLLPFLMQPPPDTADTADTPVIRRIPARAYDIQSLHIIRDRLLTLTALRTLQLSGRHLDFEVFSRPDPAIPDSLLERVDSAVIDILVNDFVPRAPIPSCPRAPASSSTPTTTFGGNNGSGSGKSGNGSNRGGNTVPGKQSALHQGSKPQARGVPSTNAAAAGSTPTAPDTDVAAFLPTLSSAVDAVAASTAASGVTSTEFYAAATAGYDSPSSSSSSPCARGKGKNKSSSSSSPSSSSSSSPSSSSSSPSTSSSTTRPRYCLCSRTTTPSSSSSPTTTNTPAPGTNRTRTPPSSPPTPPPPRRHRHRRHRRASVTAVGNRLLAWKAQHASIQGLGLVVYKNPPAVSHADAEFRLAEEEDQDEEDEMQGLGGVSGRGDMQFTPEQWLNGSARLAMQRGYWALRIQKMAKK